MDRTPINVYHGTIRTTIGDMHDVWEVRFAGISLLRGSMEGAGPAFLQAIRDLRQTCRRCGCTNYAICVGGCRWIEEDLCSRCG